MNVLISVKQSQIIGHHHHHTPQQQAGLIQHIHPAEVEDTIKQQQQHLILKHFDTLQKGQQPQHNHQSFVF